MDSYAKQTETINALELKLRNTEETLERKTQECVEIEQTHSIFKEVSDIILLEIGMTWLIRKTDVNLKQPEFFFFILILSVSIIRPVEVHNAQNAGSRQK